MRIVPKIRVEREANRNIFDSPLAPPDTPWTNAREKTKMQNDGKDRRVHVTGIRRNVRYGCIQILSLEEKLKQRLDHTDSSLISSFRGRTPSAG